LIVMNLSFVSTSYSNDTFCPQPTILKTCFA
jgi:hypothetical protein